MELWKECSVKQLNSQIQVRNTKVNGSYEVRNDFLFERGEGLEGKWKPKGSILLWIRHPGRPLPYQSAQVSKEDELSTSQSTVQNRWRAGKRDSQSEHPLDPPVPSCPPPHCDCAQCSLRLLRLSHSSYHTHCSARPSTLCSRSPCVNFPSLSKRDAPRPMHFT